MPSDTIRGNQLVSETDRCCIKAVLLDHLISRLFIDGVNGLPLDAALGFSKSK